MPKQLFTPPFPLPFKRAFLGYIFAKRLAFQGALNHLGKRVNTQKKRRGFPVNNAPGLFILGGDNSPNGDGAEKEAGDEKEGDLAVKIDVDRLTR